MTAEIAAMNPFNLPDSAFGPKEFIPTRKEAPQENELAFYEPDMTGITCSSAVNAPNSRVIKGECQESSTSGENEEGRKRVTVDMTSVMKMAEHYKKRHETEMVILNEALFQLFSLFPRNGHLTVKKKIQKFAMYQNLI